MQTFFRDKAGTVVFGKRCGAAFSSAYTGVTIYDYITHYGKAVGRSSGCRTTREYNSVVMT